LLTFQRLLSPSLTICLLPYIPIWLFSGSYINRHRRPILVCDECQKTFLILWVSIILKLLLLSSFIFIKLFPFHWFFLSMFSKFWWFSIIVHVCISICNQCFQFNVTNVFFSVIVCDYFNYYFLKICWCFLWSVFKLSTLCFCFLTFIFSISTFNICCSILQIFLFSSIFYLKMFPLFSLQTLLDFLFLFIPNMMAMMMIILRFVLCCVFSILCQIIFVCILFCTIRLLKGYSFDKIPPFGFGSARCIECVFWMWWTLNFKVMTTCELYVTFK
jgi:hypothetical protein